jgi:hypothetical protein
MHGAALGLAGVEGWPFNLYGGMVYPFLNAACASVVGLYRAVQMLIMRAAFAAGSQQADRSTEFNLEENS